MKQIISILIGLLFITAGTLQAQKIEEFEVNGNVYCYYIRDSTRKSGRVHLKSNVFKDKKCAGALIKESINFNWKDFVQKSAETFGANRLKELAKGRGEIYIIFFCDKKGVIQEVEYLLLGLTISNKKAETFLSFNEIDTFNTFITNEFKKGKYQFDLDYPQDPECHLVGVSIYFERYAEKE